MKHVDLEKFANGAFSAQVNRAIEEVTEKDRYYQIDGWAGRNGQDVTLFDTSILLKRDEDTEYYLLSTEMRQKPELGGEVGHNFSNGGFCAAIRKK